jgi:hypothetical protein
MYINTHYEQDRQFTITGGKKIRRILNLPIIEIAPRQEAASVATEDIIS